MINKTKRWKELPQTDIMKLNGRVVMLKLPGSIQEFLSIAVNDYSQPYVYG